MRLRGTGAPATQEPDAGNGTASCHSQPAYTGSSATNKPNVVPESRAKAPQYTHTHTHSPAHLPCACRPPCASAPCPGPPAWRSAGGLAAGPAAPGAGGSPPARGAGGLARGNAQEGKWWVDKAVGGGCQSVCVAATQSARHGFSTTRQINRSVRQLGLREAGGRKLADHPLPGAHLMRGWLQMVLSSISTLLTLTLRPRTPPPPPSAPPRPLLRPHVPPSEEPPGSAGSVPPPSALLPTKLLLTSE